MIILDPWVNAVIKALKEGAQVLPEGCFTCSDTRMTYWPSEKFVSLYGLKNPAGQTVLSTVLRFTSNHKDRYVILTNATIKQLALVNDDNSTALLSYFWGEYENPRHPKVDSLHTWTERVIEMLTAKAQGDEVLNATNILGESARNIANLTQQMEALTSLSSQS